VNESSSRITSAISATRRFIVQPAAWAGLCYVGYWIALLIDRVVVPLLFTQASGTSIRAWRLTPFAVAISVPPMRAPDVAVALAMLPLLFDLLLFGCVVVGGALFRGRVLRTAFDFAALWAAMLVSVQWTILGFVGNGFLRRLGGFRPRTALPLAVYAIATIGIGLFLIVLARPVAMRLEITASEQWTFARRRWVALAAVVAPMLAVMAGSYDVIEVARFAGAPALLWLAIPAGVCLAFAWSGFLFRPDDAVRRSAPMSFPGAIAAIASAIVLTTGLANAGDLRRWVSEMQMVRATSEHYEVFCQPNAFSKTFVAKFAADRESVYALLSGRLGVDPKNSIRLRVILFPDFESKSAATGTTSAYSVDDTTIRAVLGGAETQLDPAADAEALLDAVWGEPANNRVANWSARWLAGESRGQELGMAAAKLDQTLGHRTVRNLLDAGLDGVFSPLERNPLGGAWLTEIAEIGGGAAVRRLYNLPLSSSDPAADAAKALGSTPSELERRWQTWIDAYAIGMPASRAGGMPAMEMPADATMPMPRENAAPRAAQEVVYRGVDFTHEGWTGSGSGYTSSEAAAQLNAIHLLGANAVALVPYGFARGNDGTTVSYTGSDETDEDLTQAAWAAHERGMKVVLEPRLWFGRSRSNATIHFEDQEQRAAWFGSYREFLMHYALLAELDHFDVLVIGSDLGDLGGNTREWRKLIADARRVYHGPLTYAAPAGKELDLIDFWDALDFIGVDDFSPLLVTGKTHRHAGAPRAEDLAPGAARLTEQLGELSRRWHKPVLIAAAGYPSARGGAANPANEDSAAGVSQPEQAAAYEATFRAFAGRPWFRGIFWWKWPTSGIGGGRFDASYTPLGKQAEEIMREWYARMAAETLPASKEVKVPPAARATPDPNLP